jgi:hypothetical protein
MSFLSLPRAARLPARRTRGRRNADIFVTLRRWRKRGRQLWRRLNAAPRLLRIAVIAATLLSVYSAANIAYQLVRKPTEMLFPVSAALDKLPAQTWDEYGPLFWEYSTAAIAPELLAALAQVEGAGNPFARTYWRLRLSWHPFRVYAPASSAVGMYQMTDAAFADARQFCIHDHTVVAEDCWFNGLYTRILPSHAVELAAVFLDRKVAAILAQQPSLSPTARQKQDLAALVHLCGPSVARAFARRGFQLSNGARCGDHTAAAYLARVKAMQREFQRLAAAEG